MSFSMAYVNRGYKFPKPIDKKWKVHDKYDKIKFSFQSST